MENLKLIIAKNIADLRRRDGITQIQLAERLNYSDKAVSKWERGDSIPDVTVLKEIADLFGVSLDYLVEQEHTEKSLPRQTLMEKIKNHAVITGMCILLVWLIATLIFVIIDATNKNAHFHGLVFLYAVPVSMIVWLVFNSIWFNRRRNFLIISLLMWSVLGAFYISALLFSLNIWQIFLLGIPGQIIILMWSRLGYRKKTEEE